MNLLDAHDDKHVGCDDRSDVACDAWSVGANPFLLGDERIFLLGDGHDGFAVRRSRNVGLTAASYRDEAYEPFGYSDAGPVQTTPPCG